MDENQGFYAENEIEQSGNIEEVAEPQEIEGNAEGANVQDIAEPVKPEAQGADDNARFAAARRKAEAEKNAEIERVRAEAQAEINAVYRGLGMMNPYTGKLIETKDDYEAYLDAQGAEQRRQTIEQYGMSDSEYDTFISNHPEVRKARAMIAEMEAERERQRQAEAEKAFQAQVAEIGKLDESIKSIEDLQSMDNYSDFYALVQKGYSLVDAYKLANFEKMTQKTVTAEKQKAVNLANSKSHLNATKMSGAGVVAVPDSVKAQYRALNPGITDSEIQSHYEKFVKQTGQ